MNRYDIIPIIFWILLSLFVMAFSYKLEIGELRQPGPGFLPFYISLLLLIISSCVLLRYVLKKMKRGEIVIEDKSPMAFWKIGIVVVLLTAYGLFLEKLGFLISTFILANVLFKTAGMKRWSFILLGSVLTVLVTYLLFTFLGFNFPKGILRWR